uniref:Uncharacterized protein LOC105116556 isoform X2 n=1 Tax=Rhizophora mucronata TaxID=61149 RepID=A0A2P2M480_RHIMU
MHFGRLLYSCVQSVRRKTNTLNRYLLNALLTIVILTQHLGNLNRPLVLVLVFQNRNTGQKVLLIGLGLPVLLNQLAFQLDLHLMAKFLEVGGRSIKH